jgi:hypothetical protein
MVRRLNILLFALKLGALVLVWLMPAMLPTGAFAHGTEPESICSGLSLQGWQLAELYFQRSDGAIKSFSEAYLSEIIGRRISFCYIAKRSQEDVPYGIPQRGAINVKVQLWQPNGSSQVLLFNNHQDPGQACAQRDFAVYQAFQAHQIDDGCLGYGFHNELGDFSTLTPENRRFALLFPPLSLLERLFGPGERTPFKPMSQIYNYAIPQDFSLIRIPFHFSTGKEMTAARIIIQDLLDTPSGTLLDPIRIMK